MFLDFLEHNVFKMPNPENENHIVAQVFWTFLERNSFKLLEMGTFFGFFFQVFGFLGTKWLLNVEF